MKLHHITFDDDGMPETVNVTMSIDQAFAIAAVFGKMNTRAINLVGLPDLNDSPYECLVSGVFNRYWDGGYQEFKRPMFKRLRELDAIQPEDEEE